MIQRRSIEQCEMPANKGVNFTFRNILVSPEFEVSPGGWEQGNIGKISKGTREHEPILREQGNKTLQIRGRKHGKQIY